MAITGPTANRTSEPRSLIVTVDKLILQFKTATDISFFSKSIFNPLRQEDNLSERRVFLLYGFAFMKVHHCQIMRFPPNFATPGGPSPPVRKYYNCN